MHVLDRLALRQCTTEDRIERTAACQAWNEGQPSTHVLESGVAQSDGGLGLFAYIVRRWISAVSRVCNGLQ